MSQLTYVVAYAAIIVFVVAVLKRIVGYITNPIHVRWELYPVAHEPGERATYGGSYLEDVDWWNKPRESSLFNELKVMIPEILFLKAVWEYNRPLWYLTFPFHLGLYFAVIFIGLLGIGAIAQLAGIGPDAALISAVHAISNLIGPAAFILTAAGAMGLIYKRATDAELNNYSSFEHFFNLILFIVTCAVAIATWLFIDPNFNLARTFVASMITFKFAAITEPLFMVQVLLVVLTIAYIPLTHMSHFFMKYFLYHDIRWGDTPNIDTPKTDEQIGVVLNYPVSWSAPHIAGHGKETWAEVAMFNPVAKEEKEK